MQMSGRAVFGSAIFRISALLISWAVVMPSGAFAASDCGKLFKIPTHDNTVTPYALSQPMKSRGKNERIALVLLAGGGGHLDLDAAGCPQALAGNSLVRSIPLFVNAGFITALVDAPSDYQGEEGLGGFRTGPAHAEDLGKIVADVRKRTGARVWIVGTSRGTISAVNAASRLTGSSAPDGVVITSALTSGKRGGRKAWVADTVFDLPLESIRIPILVVGHAEDKCVRTPVNLMEKIVKRTNGVREQVVTVTGGPGWSGPVDVQACIGRSPHGYVEQEAEVVEGISRFVKGGKY